MQAGNEKPEFSKVDQGGAQQVREAKFPAENDHSVSQLLGVKYSWQNLGRNVAISLFNHRLSRFAFLVDLPMFS